MLYCNFALSQKLLHMEIDDLKKVQSVLKRLFNDFNEAYTTMEEAACNRERAAAQRSAEEAISLACYHISKKQDLYKYITGISQQHSFQNYKSYDTFIKPECFRNMMPQLLDIISNKIVRRQQMR